MQTTFIFQLKNICLLSCLFFIFTACNTNNTPPIPSQNFKKQYQKLAGKTMGTTYHITVEAKNIDSLQTAIDEVLKHINLSVNTYIDNSFITQFNQSKDGATLPSESDTDKIISRHFTTNFKTAQRIYQESKGAFDPTVMPLVAYWGFSRKKEKVNDFSQKTVDSLLQFVGMDKVNLTENGFVKKEKPGTSLDFSALAKGYGIDMICEMFDQKGLENYFVEIGGEVRTKGINPRKTPWVIGISTPNPEANLQDLYAQVKLSNIALASSGNYRNYHEVDGQKYGHTINPKTGLPEKSKLLSASIFAKDCMTADAYATACMSMGLEKSMALISQLNNIEGYFIYDDNGKFAVQQTKGMDQYLLGINKTK